LNRVEFLSRFDFHGYIISRFSTIIETSEEDRIRVNCPMCDDTSGHLYILLSAGLPYCQKCKYNPRSPVKFIADLERISFAEVFKLCGDSFSHVDTSVDEVVDSLFEEEEEKFFEYAVMEFENSFIPLFEKTNIFPIDSALGKAEEYLLDRGLSKKTINKYKIRYCYDGQYAGRIIVPCFYKEDLVTFVARDIFGSSSRKYLNPKGNKQSDFLFNWGAAGSEQVVLTEGVFDAISAGEVSYSVASFGKSLSERQISLLNGFKRVIFYWDLDAYPQAERYAEVLQSDCLVVLHCDGKDAGSRSFQENKSLIESAVRFDSVDYEMFKLLELTS